MLLLLAAVTTSATASSATAGSLRNYSVAQPCNGRNCAMSRLVLQKAESAAIPMKQSGGKKEESWMFSPGVCLEMMR